MDRSKYNPQKYELHNIWSCMVRRKGATVCPQWSDRKTGFRQFVQDIGLRPSKKHRLSRIDTSRPWIPDNVRWSTDRIPNNSKLVEFGGHTRPLNDWARRFGLPYLTLRTRLKHMEFIDAILTPIRSDRSVTFWVIEFVGPFHGRDVTTRSARIDTARAAWTQWNRYADKKPASSTLRLLRLTNGVETEVMAHRAMTSRAIQDPPGHADGTVGLPTQV